YIVEHRLAAVGRASREVDLELAGETLGVRVAQEPPGRCLRPGGDVELLLGAGTREVATHHVAHGVAACLSRGQPDRGEEPQDLRRPFELDEVELDVLTSREMTPPA